MAAKKYKKRRLWIVLAVLAAILLAAAGGVFFYLNTGVYRAQALAAELMEKIGGTRTDRITVTQDGQGRLVAAPENPAAGLVFYPGAKVEYEAYLPLMEELAGRGIFCVLVHMPGNLAILDMDAATSAMEAYPGVERWYIGGHSLGGAMAASYAAKHADRLEGLLLLAAYSTEDLNGTGLRVMSVYGTQDRVLNRESYEKYRANLPEDAAEVILEGGCHSYFGDYGMQKGDGEPSIDRSEQLRRTADAFSVLAGANRPELGALSGEWLDYFTEYFSEQANNGFLLSDYERIEDASLEQIFYNGAGLDSQPAEQAVQLYERTYGELMTDAVALTKSQINAFLLTKTGKGLDEFTEPLDWPYLPEADLYMTQHGDTNYTSFVCESGEAFADGTVTLRCVSESSADGPEQIVCSTTVSLKQDVWQFVSNRREQGILPGDLEMSEESEEIGDGAAGPVTDEVLGAVRADADTSAVAGFDRWGDWDEISRESLCGVWYEPPVSGSEVVLSLSEDKAYVYFPALELDGTQPYDWEVEDRSASGLCPALKIYVNGALGGPLAWYVAGIGDGYFWCNAQQEIFYRQ
ncbi:MAG: alpha/beta hydrolase [Eubacteriales bacterium]|nr:alpha/beta hydrolase [Eubacteriales bacterium]